jgi:hypothetical protein
MSARRITLIALIAALYSWTPPPGSWVVIALCLWLGRHKPAVLAAA